MRCAQKRSIVVVLWAALVVGAGLGISARAQTLVALMDLGKDGGGVVVNPNTHRVYVAVAGQLNVYDARTHALTGSIPLPQNYVRCYDLALDLAHGRIYATGFRTYVIDANSHAVLQHYDVAGTGVAVNPTTNRIYVVGKVDYPYSAPYVIHVLDGTSLTWLPDIPLGSTGEFDYVHLAVHPGTNRVYVTFTGDDNLRILDGNSHAELGRLPFPNIGPVAVNPATNRVYVRTPFEGAVVLDGTTHSQLGTIKIGGQLRINPRTNRIYGVASRSPGYIVQVADGATNAVVGYVYLDGDLESYDLDPELGKLFGTSSTYPASWARKMAVIQDASPTSPAPTAIPGLVATLPLPYEGDGVAVNTATNRVYVGVDGGLAVFDASTLAQLSFVDLSSGSYRPPIYAVGVDEALNRIYAVSVSQTFVVNGANHQRLGEILGGDDIAVNSANARVYIGDDAVFLGEADRLRIYDGTTLALIRNLSLGVSSHYESVAVAVNPSTGYAYCTYSYHDNLRIISPLTDDVERTIPFTSTGRVAVNPVTNRVYVWMSRGSQSGALILDGHTHAELGVIQGISGQLETNPATNRLYGYTGWTLFQIVDAATKAQVGRVFLDGDIQQYAVHPALARLYVTHSDYPAEWGKELSVIQDSGGPPPPTPTPTPTPVWTHWLHLPLCLKGG